MQKVRECTWPKKIPGTAYFQNAPDPIIVATEAR